MSRTYPGHVIYIAFLMNMMAGVFRSNVFDPILVVSQIVAMQCSFYSCLGLWLILANAIAGIRYSIDQFFDFHELQGPHDGWLVMGAVVLNSITNSVALRLIVRRAKLCLDFTITIYLVHFIVCVCYAGLPHSWAWWLCNIIAMLITAIFGEYLCMAGELAAIPVGASQGKT